MMRWGPEPIAPDRTRFRLWAPDLGGVSLEIEGSGAVPMTRVENGWFTIETQAGPGSLYRFLVGNLAIPDPASRAQSGDVHGWSVVVDPDAYRWRMPEWRGRRWTETVIQEVHAGLLGGFAGVAERLPALSEFGVTAVELMPIGAFGGTRNWGYDGVLPYAPAASYGSPADLKALVDRAHELGLMIFLDVVYNHFGPDGNYLNAYASAFFHPEVSTPWGSAIALDREPVRRFFIDNALMWLGEYRFDGLRFDAVHALRDDVFLDEMAAEIRVTLGEERHIHLILENERNDAARLGPTRYDAQWNDDFHNVLHVMLTGETSSYYADFAEEPDGKLARCLAEGFIYQGEASINHGGEPRGTPSGHLPPSAFVAFLQNHDQIGNRALGERLTQLTDPARLRAATALLLLCPQIPLIFMGDEVGSRSPFLFFTDFHDELAEAVREGRRREFAWFPAFADVKAREAIPDPNALATFERSRPEAGPDAPEWRRLYRELLALRAREIVPRLAGARAIGAEVIGPGAVLARWRMGDGAVLNIALNLGDRPVSFPSAIGEALYEMGEPGASASLLAWLNHG